MARLSFLATSAFDDEGIAISGKRLLRLLLGQECLADIGVGPREIELAIGIATVLGHQRLGDGEAVAIGGKRLLRLVLGQERLADIVVGHRGMGEVSPHDVDVVACAGILIHSQRNAIGCHRFLQPRRASEQDQIARLSERRLDRRPKMWGCRQARVVTKHT